MDRYFEVFKECKNFPQEMNEVIQKDIRIYPVSPDDFRLLKEELVLRGSVTEAIDYVRNSTEQLAQEHTLVLYGEHHVNSGFMRDYSIGIGKENVVGFRDEQLKMARKTYKQPHGEVVYAHTHVGTGKNYNCFSVSDLLFLIRQAFRNKRDVYGMLITKDAIIPVKYSYSGNEFFRIQIVIA